MMMTETKPGRGGPPPSDPWEDWKPVWDKNNPATPHDLQETHSPTAAVPTGLAGGRMQRNQRRIVDLRLWEAMSPAQQDAAIEIARAYEMMSRGLGFATSDPSRLPSGGGGQVNIGALYARVVRGYVEWTSLCQKAKISHSMIIDALVFGLSLRQSDQDRRVKKGASRRNLLEGLDIYCRMRGW